LRWPGGRSPWHRNRRRRKSREELCQRDVPGQESARAWHGCDRRIRAPTRLESCRSLSAPGLRAQNGRQGPTARRTNRRMQRAPTTRTGTRTSEPLSPPRLRRRVPRPVVRRNGQRPSEPMRRQRVLATHQRRWPLPNPPSPDRLRNRGFLWTAGRLGRPPRPGYLRRDQPSLKHALARRRP
jgi:hypothetical protein